MGYGVPHRLVVPCCRMSTEHAPAGGDLRSGLRRDADRHDPCCMWRRPVHPAVSREGAARGERQHTMASTVSIVIWPARKS